MPASVPSSTRGYRFSARGAAAIVAALLALLLTFHRAIAWLWQTWTERAEYSHGPMLPVVAAFLIWQRRDPLRRAAFVGDWAGPAVLLLAAAANVIGEMGGVYTLQQYALVLGLAGLALAVVGRSAFRELLAPMMVLVLAVPAPNFILNNLSARLQLLSSSLGVDFIRAMGISVFLEGNIIDLGGYRLQVVEACDGMRYLFPLMTIGLLIAYLYKGAMWKRVVVFVLSVPITVFMNSLRVGSIGLLVDRWGTGMAEGFLHEFQGWMVFMLSIGLLLGATVALNGIGRDRAPWHRRFGLSDPPAPAADVAPGVRRLPRSFGAALAICAALALGSWLLPAWPEIIPARTAFAAFPLTLGEWTGRREALGAEFLDVLQLDDYVLADFADRHGGNVNLYATYYSTQRDRRVVHSPRACIPGGGWHIDELSQVTVPGTALRVNRMLILNGDARQLVYYWFDQRGRDLTSELSVKWFLFWDSVTRHRSDGAMVRLITPVGRGEDTTAAEARLMSFAGRTAAAIHEFVPP